MTREFFDLSVPLLSEGGLIILDDAIKYRLKMDGFHEYLESQNIGYEIIQTDEDDGVMVIDF
jgi:predicted O-methyltransferase YrrM